MSEDQKTEITFSADPSAVPPGPLDAVTKDRDDLKKANDELTNAINVQAQTIAGQQDTIAQIQLANRDLVGHIVTLAKVLGRVMT